MKKISYKRALVTGILFSVVFLTSLTFATTSASNQQRNKTKAQHSQAGCMACHQNEAALPSKPAKKTG